ncbi:DoxX-like protein [Nocardia tenerifensis]|uniref:DoxX-like protein n=1 Tax=Nocardia tenerifensis TaxID=228006 RepID=A0A318K5V9_9NOCA|nr:DoxX family protein [Nocardia tenerifensis]PXX64043.1 DoxX-like protein [Nocardia tenerifensis]
MKTSSKDVALRVAYLGATGVLLTESVVGSYWDIARIPYVRDVFDRLEYPMYFATILGVAKAAAVAAIVLPAPPKAEEWAYAGLTFVYGGAAASHVAVGDEPKAWVGPLVFAGLTLTSWGLRPPRGRRNPLALLRRSARA